MPDAPNDDRPILDYGGRETAHDADGYGTTVFAIRELMVGLIVSGSVVALIIRWVRSMGE